MRESLETNRESAADRAIQGFTYPLDDQDMLKLEQKMRDSWVNDNALLKIWSKIENSILTSFRLAETTKLLKSLIQRDQRISGRALIPFRTVGWLSAQDVRDIEEILYWCSMITRNRPGALSPPVAKDVDREAPIREISVIQGSILTIPPAPKRAEVWLKGLISKAEGLLPKLRNIEKRVTRRDDIKKLYRATDPNLSMRDRGKEPYTAIPKSDFFQTVSV